MGVEIQCPYPIHSDIRLGFCVPRDHLKTPLRVHFVKGFYHELNSLAVGLGDP